MSWSWADIVAKKPIFQQSNTKQNKNSNSNSNTKLNIKSNTKPNIKSNARRKIKFDCNPPIHLNTYSNNKQQQQQQQLQQQQELKQNNYELWNKNIKFYSRQEILTELIKFNIITSIAEMIWNYAKFVIHPTWCDLSQYDPTQYKYMSTSRFELNGDSVAYDSNILLKDITDERYIIEYYGDNLQKTFGFDFSYSDSHVKNIPNYKIRINSYRHATYFVKPNEYGHLTFLNDKLLDRLYFENEIIFFDFANDKSDFHYIEYEIKFDILQKYLENIINVNDSEQFYNFLEKMYNDKTNKNVFNNVLNLSKTPNKHLIENDNKKTKIKEVWQAWIKIFGPILVYHYHLPKY
jgi:hypothetical protein